MKNKQLLYLIPYFFILLLGVWYRMHQSTLALLNYDSGNYLLPPFIKMFTGEWHKGERPMAYLQFIYGTLSTGNELRYTILWQQILSLTGAGFIAGAWLVFINKLSAPKFLLHLLGYVLLLFYVSSPGLLYYERLIGPEAISIFLMCVLIFLLTAAFSIRSKGFKFRLLIAGAVFFNLLLSAFLTKWVFATWFLEFGLVYALLKYANNSLKGNLFLLAVPHLFYFCCITFSESVHQIDLPNQNRLYITYQQMAFTHFAILADDKSNFEVAGPLQDSLMQYLHDAQKTGANQLLGFNADDLMWGKANFAIEDYFKHHPDSLMQFYKKLNWKLATKYPAQLSRDILKQAAAFYFPNRFIHKDIYAAQDAAEVYSLSVQMADRFDADLSAHLVPSGAHSLKYCLHPHNNGARMHLLEPDYPVTLPGTGAATTGSFNSGFFFFRWFDYEYILVLLLFFAVKFFRKELFKPSAVSLFYLLTGIYVFTVSMVHTFDIPRFVFTVYPFLLVTTFMAAAYVIAGGKKVTD